MENLQYFLDYSPVIVLILVYFIQMKIFVTPEALEKKHREILQEAERRFAPGVSVNELKEQFSDMKDKIDKIYDYFLCAK